MKKNKIILAVSAVMLMGAIAPVYYWHKKEQSRFPASQSAEQDESSEVKVYAIPESEEKIIVTKLEDAIEDTKVSKKIELENGVVIFPQPEIESKIEVTKLPLDIVVCQKEDSDKLSVDMKKLIQDKEDLLKEIALLKKSDKKELPKDDKKIADAPKVDMMAQLTSLMMSQQTQQQLMMMQMMQMMSSMQANQQSNGVDGLFSPYGLSHDQYQSHARVNSQAPVYNFYNSTVTMGMGQQMGAPSVLSQFAQPSYGIGLGLGQGLMSPYAMSPYSLGGGIGIGGIGIGGMGTGALLDYSMKAPQNPMYHDGFNFSDSFNSSSEDHNFRETASKLSPTFF